MCGFLGTFLVKKKLNLELLRHRGPDSIGYYEDDYISLGFCRLKIIDLSDKANQPMSYDNLIIAFNGEIYNFLELKNELLEYEFRTKSDTEVLLYTFHKFGVLNGLKKIVGMFSIVLYDKNERKIYLIRDRAGIKPLYYAFYKNGIVFSSEIKPILDTLEKKDINIPSLINHFTFLFNFDENTAFSNVYKLKQAHVLEFSEVGKRLYPYWKYEFYNEIKDIKEAKEKFVYIFDEVVKSQLISDVEVGIFLSGGIDSSLISIFSSKYRKLKAFSLIYKKSDIVKDEYKYAKVLSERLGIDLEGVVFEMDEEILDKFVYYIEEPVGDPAGISTYLMCDYNKSRVIISGMGGDEIFGGYPRYRAYSLYKKLHFLPVHRIYFPKLFGKISRDIEKLKRVWNKPYYYYLSYYDDKDVRELFKYNYEPFKTAFEIYKGINGNFYERMLIFDFMTFLPEHNLLYSDKLSMSKSVEMRVPFLDDRILEFSMLLDTRIKMDKLLLKEVLKNYFPDVVKRKKMGFGGPIRTWLYNNKDLVIREVEKLKTLDFINMDKVRKVVNEEFSNKKFNYLQVFQFLVVSRWLEVFKF